MEYYEHVAPDYVDNIITLRGNMATSLSRLGREEESLSIKRECYQYLVHHEGKTGERAMSQAYNIAVSLAHLKKNAEAISLMREQLPLVKRVLDNDHELTLKFQKLYAKTLFAPP